MDGLVESIRMQATKANIELKHNLKTRACDWYLDKESNCYISDLLPREYCIIAAREIDRELHNAV